jgi:hypothetical protein
LTNCISEDLFQQWHTTTLVTVVLAGILENIYINKGIQLCSQSCNILGNYSSKTNSAVAGIVHLSYCHKAKRYFFNYELEHLLPSTVETSHFLSQGHQQLLLCLWSVARSEGGRGPRRKASHLGHGEATSDVVSWFYSRGWRIISPYIVD